MRSVQSLQYYCPLNSADVAVSSIGIVCVAMWPLRCGLDSIPKCYCYCWTNYRRWIESMCFPNLNASTMHNLRRLHLVWSTHQSSSNPNLPHNQHCWRPYLNKCANANRYRIWFLCTKSTSFPKYNTCKRKCARIRNHFDVFPIGPKFSWQISHWNRIATYCTFRQKCVRTLLANCWCRLILCKCQRNGAHNEKFTNQMHHQLTKWSRAIKKNQINCFTETHCRNFAFSIWFQHDKRNGQSISRTKRIKNFKLCDRLYLLRNQLCIYKLNRNRSHKPCIVVHIRNDVVYDISFYFFRSAFQQSIANNWSRTHKAMANIMKNVHGIIIIASDW